MKHNNNPKETKPVRLIARWIFLSFAILLNGFIICYSCISEAVTISWNKAFSNAFASIVNGITHKKVEQVPLESISATFSSEEEHKYNYLNGYELNEIPLGSAKQVDCSFLPLDATNKSVVYTASPSDLVQLNQSGSIVSVVGMKVGDCVLTATSSDGGFTSSVDLKIVDPVAPTSYKISIKNNKISLGSTETIEFDIDGGVLGHNELINFRYYDTRKLKYISSDNDIATVDENGVIYPKALGNATITVKNNDFSESVIISVVSGTAPTPFANLSIAGSDVCYSNDMILNQNYPSKYHYQLVPKDGESELNPEDFIWSSSNELLAKVDKHGVLRGFRKSSLDDETVLISAKSKTTGQIITHQVTVKVQLPTELYFSFETEGKTVWDETAYTFSVGENVPLNIAYNSPVQNKQVTVVCSDESIIGVTNEGAVVTLHILKPGTCNISITSVINPELVKEIKCTVVKAGAISKDNYLNVTTYLRKSVGHAAVFMVAQIFTFLTLFMFFYSKKWWFYSSISLGEGLFISALSELIQFFVPSRSGTFIDILINFAGVLVGALIGFAITLIINRRKKKKL